MRHHVPLRGVPQEQLDEIYSSVIHKRLHLLWFSNMENGSQAILYGTWWADER